MIQVSEEWRAAHPGAYLGVLAMTGVANPTGDPRLEEAKKLLEEELRVRYAGYDKAAFRRLATGQVYEAYYRRWDKGYVVLSQLESVAVKGKSIPSVAALVEAMFMAELKHLLLTAGHDLAKVVQPLTLGVTAGGESFTGISGRAEVLKAGDMMMRDGEDIIASVLYGPDARTKLTAETTDAVFTVYAPAGIEPAAVVAHLEDMAAYVRLVAPAARTAALEVVK